MRKVREAVEPLTHIRRFPCQQNTDGSRHYGIRTEIFVTCGWDKMNE